MKSDFEDAASRLEATILEFSMENFNRRPDPQKWSAAGIAEHLAKVDGFVVKVMEGEMQATKRDPELKSPYLEAVYESRRKFETLPPLFPSDNLKDPGEVGQQLREIRNQIMQKAADHSLEALSTMEHPHFGHLTVIEYLYFVIYHGERHRNQMVDLIE